MVAFDEKYRAHGLEILGFPCNQFANQEPWSKEKIREFVNKYNVKFQLFEKIKVNGTKAHPLYKFLKKEQSAMLGGIIKWNFTKFVIDREGNVVYRLSPKTSLASKEDEICALLGCDKIASNTDQAVEETA